MRIGGTAIDNLVALGLWALGPSVRVSRKLPFCGDFGIEK